MKKLLTVAGSDSGGGAGIQADLKTFSALGAYGMSVITAVTAQNTVKVMGITEIPPSMVEKQITAVLSDIGTDAVKVGMLAGKDIISAVSRRLEGQDVGPVVLDPVMVSESGHRLLNKGAEKALKEKLFPLAGLVTPNLAEASVLTGRQINNVEKMQKAAEEIYSLGPGAVLVKGGHLPGRAVDILFNGRQYHEIVRPRLEVENTHGTGCTYSSAIAVYLARGVNMAGAVEKARDYLQGTIKNGLDIGAGAGPTDHFYRLRKRDREGVQ
ncbi:MAG: bifunctional hydroxymethylpyrimidine kinase/phosphomethylpyrimidine kinase [Halanaerobiales bacterium]